MVRQSRSDIAQLLSNGRFSEALPKAKQFYEDERRLSAYDQVELFCRSILQNISSLKHESDVNLLLEETKEAMAGMIFAASRIGELEDLQHIRSLFVQRFGLQFDKDCVNLRQGNVVGSEIVKILDTSVRKDEITHIVMELSQKYQTNIATSADSISKDSASSDDLGISDPDVMKVEKMKRVRRKEVVNENSKFMHPNLGEFQGRDRSFMR
ncbi:Vacuolar protein sorting-associated protein Ist1 [Arabidopsis thaliana x Arabidopsis arenosa]|uniref:Vacuolar protein sorting-associated protein Ist1 n=1 Tax=Arabidopsis thaliana x Arabidopsis arenosa TaxID=1240361 RepID=A0A8T2ARX8_9BRAS|nr:Vacuolar protein sorting-associated protein Ist1 [Arabidopsis thaliana x Arabidopsis arenosa]